MSEALSTENQEEKNCGIIMPISSMHGYSAEHWQDVKRIIIEAVESIVEHKFKTELVSDSDGVVEVIHKRIIQNIYNAEMVVCDISGKNPNVLFELGMRLTFDKPTIIIKDNDTDYIFDTGVIEHLTYPKDLRFTTIVEFKKELAKKIKQTYEKSIQDVNYSTFLGNFGTFVVPTLEQTPLTSENQMILENLNQLRYEIISIKKSPPIKNINRENDYLKLKKCISEYLRGTNESEVSKILNDNSLFDMFEIYGIDSTNYSKEFLHRTIKAEIDNLHILTF